MKRITPSLLIILGLLILLASLTVYHVLDVRRLNSEIQELQLVLNRTETHLDMVIGAFIRADEALERERAIVTSGQGLRNFVSLDELEQFLAEDDTDKHEYVKIIFDCDDFAIMLQEHAFKKGFIINCQKLPVGGIEHLHNLVIIGNELYFVEARTDIVTYVGFLD